ncbi:MAG: LysR family transcriptional regulator [Roseiflexaceae bacterium]|nr:LysR family transcriptional regulator [Roseiflexaceae bacterium]
MELLQLRYFRVVARTEHITKAAEELCIAQPSLSKTIRRLEQEVGVALFDRQGRSIRLNQYGKAFLSHIDALFHELEEGQRKVRDMAHPDRGEVSLIAASLNWLPEVLQRFQTLHPAIRFQLSQCALTEMVQRLEAGACDFCFQSTPPIKAGIAWQPLLTHEILLVLSPHHRLAGRHTVPLAAVAHEAVVIEQIGHGLHDLIDDYCRQAGFALRIGCEVDEPASLFGFVKSNLGVAFAPASVKQQIAEYGLVSLHLAEPRCACTFGMAWHQARHLSGAARAFQQFMVTHFGSPKANVPLNVGGPAALR